MHITQLDTGRKVYLDRKVERSHSYCYDGAVYEFCVHQVFPSVCERVFNTHN